MALTERTRPYEVFIRYAEDGSVYAHKRTITEALEGAVVKYATENAPTPLVIGDVPQILGEFLPAAVVAQDTARAQVAALTAERDALAEQLSAAQQTISELQA